MKKNHLYNVGKKIFDEQFQAIIRQFHLSFDQMFPRMILSAANCHCSGYRYYREIIENCDELGFLQQHFDHKPQKLICFFLVVVETNP